MVSFQEWRKLELRIAKVLSVEDIVGKDKLYKVQIDLGSEKRQIVAGLKGHYSKEELRGKNIVVVSNPEPVTIAGVESQAMLLAAKDSEGKYRVVTIDAAVQPGIKVE